MKDFSVVGGYAIGICIAVSAFCVTYKAGPVWGLAAVMAIAAVIGALAEIAAILRTLKD